MTRLDCAAQVGPCLVGLGLHNDGPILPQQNLCPGWLCHTVGALASGGHLNEIWDPSQSVLMPGNYVQIFADLLGLHSPETVNETVRQPIV